MKYVILIHSNPQPWGHPTASFLPEFQALPKEEQDRMFREFDELLTEIHQSGELVTAAALGDPTSAGIYRWDTGAPLATDGPYSESKEHLAGFFLIDVDTRERADEIATRFAGPGDVIELRPVMNVGGDDE